jgi:hypothetical protein
LAACVLALIAERWTARRVLIISTSPSALLGTPDVWPALAGQNRPCGGLGVGGVGLLEVARRASPPVLGALHLKHLDPLALKWRASAAP